MEVRVDNVNYDSLIGLTKTEITLQIAQWLALFFKEDVVLQVGPYNININYIDRIH